MIDCHSHLSFMNQSQLDSVLGKKNLLYPKQWILGGYDSEDWQKQIEIDKSYPNRIRTCFGLHPWKLIELDSQEIDKQMLELEALSSRCDFVGETGVDFFRDSKKEYSRLQEEVFRRHLSLNSKKPFVFHIVQAHDLSLNILKNFQVKGFVHGFSGSFEIAQRYLDKGILLSFGPGVLSKNYKKARAALKGLPLDGILIESDAPSLHGDIKGTVEAYEKVALEVAKIKQIEVGILLEQIEKNVGQLMGDK